MVKIESYIIVNFGGPISPNTVSLPVAKAKAGDL